MTKPREKIFVFHTSRYIDNPMIDGVIIDAGAEDYFTLLDKYGDKVRQLHLNGSGAGRGGDAFPGLPANAKKGLPRVLKYFAQSKEEVIRYSQPLKEKNWLVCPLFPIEKREDVSFITSMGIAVDLLYRIDQMDQSLVLDILHYYLHYPSLEMPIEPFHSILTARLKRKTLLLWHLHLMFPGLFLHVDDTGVSATPAQLTAKEYLYLVDWENHSIKKNEAPGTNKKNLKSYFETMPQVQPECMPCAHFHQCFGWAKYGKDTCAKWKAVLDTIQRNVKELEKTCHG